MSVEINEHYDNPEAFKMEMQTAADQHEDVSFHVAGETFHGVIESIDVLP